MGGFRLQTGLGIYKMLVNAGLYSIAYLGTQPHCARGQPRHYFCAMKVHSELGPGLLESAYTACLQFQLREAGFECVTQIALPVVYRGVKLDAGYRIDLLVEDLVLVEIKSVDAISPVHHAQVITYLKLSGKSLGLLI